MPDSYRPGDRVRIVIDATVEDDYGTFLKIRTDHGRVGVLVMEPALYGARVERLSESEAVQ